MTKFNPLMKSLSRRFTLKSHSVELKGEEIEELRRSFAAADLDQSGTLDQEEIYKVLSAHAKISEAQASKLMEDADADKTYAYVPAPAFFGESAPSLKKVRSRSLV